MNSWCDLELRSDDFYGENHGGLTMAVSMQSIDSDLLRCSPQYLHQIEVEQSVQSIANDWSCEQLKP